MDTNTIIVALVVVAIVFAIKCWIITKFMV